MLALLGYDALPDPWISSTEPPEYWLLVVTKPLASLSMEVTFEVWTEAPSTLEPATCETG